MRVVITPRAERALQGIGDWIALDDRARAETFLLELREKCMWLADFPRAFPVVARRGGKRIHCRPHGNYLILYEIGLQRISVLTVQHAGAIIDAGSGSPDRTGTSPAPRD